MITDLTHFMKSTGLSEDEIAEIVGHLNLQTFEKGTILLEQGQTCSRCYFVIKGCIRQYGIKDDGKENTVEFYTEEQAAVIFKSYKEGTPSEFYLECAETTFALVGDLESETMLYAKFPRLLEITRAVMESSMGAAQTAYAHFVRSTPEERYLGVLENRPDLIQRVPQHQLASYLGLTPESLSRIKKRVAEHGKPMLK